MNSFKIHNSISQFTKSCSITINTTEHACVFEVYIQLKNHRIKPPTSHPATVNKVFCPSSVWEASCCPASSFDWQWGLMNSKGSHCDSATSSVSHIPLPGSSFLQRRHKVPPQRFTSCFSGTKLDKRGRCRKAPLKNSQFSLFVPLIELELPTTLAFSGLGDRKQD